MCYRKGILFGDIQKYGKPWLLNNCSKMNKKNIKTIAFIKVISKGGSYAGQYEKNQSIIVDNR